jgi:hypothetical protein
MCGQNTKYVSTIDCDFVLQITVDSCYYDSDGIRKMYQYNQTIDIASMNFYCLGMVGIQIVTLYYRLCTAKMHKFEIRKLKYIAAICIFLNLKYLITS